MQVHQFLNSLSINLSIKSRQKALQIIKKQNITASILINYIAQTTPRNQVLFTCILDDMVDVNPSYLKDELNAFITLATQLKIETCKRCNSRIFANLLATHPDFFTQQQKKQLVTMHFDWLLTNSLVATRVNCITVLYELRDQADWITTDLVAIIEQQVSLQEPSFISRSKKILHKIRKQAKQ
ncbi:hypothetical protein K5I29_01070 [Flavobacterium agricola]|uniref:Adenylosuccinate lyase n=1 Tax=Flavobacterium agricola TaxID=2870839 RepID=A0ABY6M2Z9_9FLAO|nr:hypothetical protein [Flavobacterium agricola]UYW01551.1 hypothetical protein K5I29_01070 [Flavobacterium agricola]